MDTRTREELIAANAQALTENALLKERLAALESEVEMLRNMLSGGGKGSSAAPFVKPSRQQRREPNGRNARSENSHLCASAMWQQARFSTLWRTARIAAGS